MISIHIAKGSKKGLEEPCTEQERRVVRVAYNNYLATFFEVQNGNMVEYQPSLNKEEWHSISYDWEILGLFFTLENLTQEWIFCNNTWGWFDRVTGHWTGAVGKVIGL